MDYLVVFFLLWTLDCEGFMKILICLRYIAKMVIGKVWE